MNDSRDPDAPVGTVGFVSLCLMLTGGGSIVAGLMAVINGSNTAWNTGSTFQAAGVCGIAAAISFGSLLIALLRR